MSAPTFSLSGYLDGFCLRFDGDVIATYPNFDAAAAGLKAGREALPMLAAALAITARKDA